MIEHGKRMPELGALIDFADFYDVSLDYLLKGKEEATMNNYMEYLEERDIGFDTGVELIRRGHFVYFTIVYMSDKRKSILVSLNTILVHSRHLIYYNK